MFAHFIIVCLLSFQCVCVCVCMVLLVNVFLCLSSRLHLYLLFSGSLSVLFLPVLPTTCLQVRTLASAGGPDNLVMLDPSKYKSRPKVPEPVGEGSSTHPKWQVGEQEFEALMRMLDNLVGTKSRAAALVQN